MVADMTDKVSVSPGFGCAPLPLSTGRIANRLPFLEYRSSKPNLMLWLSRDSKKSVSNTTGFLKPLILDMPAKTNTAAIDLDIQTRLSQKNANKKGHLRFPERNLATSDGTRSFVTYGREEIFRRHTAPERKHVYTPFITRNRPHTCESWSSEDNLVFSGGAEDFESLRSSSRTGLSRYTPLPAIGKPGQINHEDQHIYLHQSLNNLDLEEWRFPPISTTPDRKLPPLLRPLVRSRTFTILSCDEENDDQSWTLDEKEETRPDSRNSRSSLEMTSSLSLFLVVTLPDGAKEENHFDREDTFQDVFRFASRGEEDSTDWKFVTDGDDSPRIFTDFSQTLANARIQSRTNFVLQRTDS